MTIAVLDKDVFLAGLNVRFVEECKRLGIRTSVGRVVLSTEVALDESEAGILVWLSELEDHEREAVRELFETQSRMAKERAEERRGDSEYFRQLARLRRGE